MPIIKLEGELKLTGVASDGASVSVPVSINIYGPEGVTLNDTEHATNVLGGSLRAALNRANAMLAAVP